MHDRLRICHVMPTVAHGPLSFDDLTSGGRGVTGSESSLLYLAKAQAAMGHEVVCYIVTDMPGQVEGMELIDYRSAYPKLRRVESADVVISWLSADPLRAARPEAARILSTQINDWLLSAYGWEKHVDVVVACSRAHQAWLEAAQGCPSGLEWAIIPNGVDLTRYSFTETRQPYRCVYISSPDRGLHWALWMWPEIRFTYPQAELHIFYEVARWMKEACIMNSDIGMRASYIRDRIPALSQHGVHLRGAVAPLELVKELAKSDILLYPSDPVRPTEGFGVAVLDACAAGVVPVITDSDAFGEVYGASGAVVVPRGDGAVWTDTYLAEVLRLLKDRAEIDARRDAVRAFARGYDWRLVAAQWDALIREILERKS